MLLITANYQIITLYSLSTFSEADIMIDHNYDGEYVLKAGLIEPLLRSHSASIKEFTYVTESIEHQLPGREVKVYMDHGTEPDKKSKMMLHGVSPSTELDQCLHSTYESNELLGETTSLYTARGEQGMGSTYSDLDYMSIFIDPYDEMSNRMRWHYETTTSDTVFAGKRRYTQVKRPLFTLS